jgi:hypothetical protein
MYESLVNRLGRFTDDTVLYPGHRYSVQPYASMGETRAENSVFRPTSVAQWLAVFGR